MDLSEQFALMYTEVQAPLPHRTMEYDNLTVLGLYLYGIPEEESRTDPEMDQGELLQWHPSDSIFGQRT